MHTPKNKTQGQRMGQISHWITTAVKQTASAFLRYPLPFLSVILIYVLCALSIDFIDFPNSGIITLIFTAFLGLFVNAVSERLNLSVPERIFLNVMSALAGIVYFLFSFDTPYTVGYAAGVRLSVLLFALFCLFIWTPSMHISGKWKYEHKTAQPFPFYGVIMSCFKLFFITLLYICVACLGVLLIHTVIDLLLIDLSSDSLMQMILFVCVLFGPIYLLGAIPRFHSERDAARTESAAQCPRFLEILLCYIIIPIITLLTLVFVIYLLKTLITTQWPSGRIGGLVLIYSAIGLALYILTGPLENRFAQLYQRLFPAMLIPLVIMQIVSVYIRLNAYGITESRYYVLLAALFSLISALLLGNAKKNGGGGIFLIAAILALLSLVPPLDAFSLSRRSQTGRLETILESEQMLVDNTLYPSAIASEETRAEVTSITLYLYNRGYTNKVAWLPKAFNPYDFDNTPGSFYSAFGFERYYPYYNDGVHEVAVVISLENDAGNGSAVEVSGYDAFLHESYFYQSMGHANNPAVFTIEGKRYTLQTLNDENGLPYAELRSGDEGIVLSIPLSEDALRIASAHGSDASLPEDEMSVLYESGDMRAKVRFGHIRIVNIADSLSDLSFSCQFLFGLK